MSNYSDKYGISLVLVVVALCVGPTFAQTEFTCQCFNWATPEGWEHDGVILDLEDTSTIIDIECWDVDPSCAQHCEDLGVIKAATWNPQDPYPGDPAGRTIEAVYCEEIYRNSTYQGSEPYVVGPYEMDLTSLATGGDCEGNHWTGEVYGNICCGPNGAVGDPDRDCADLL